MKWRRWFQTQPRWWLEDSHTFYAFYRWLERERLKKRSKA